MKDFFISYTARDRSWAKWVAESLGAEGYTTVVQAHDFPPGSNFVLEMHKATVECRRTVVILSQAYLGSDYAMSEFAAAYADDPGGAKRKVLPVRVEQCEATGLLRQIVYCDLVGVGEEEARARLLGAARVESPEPEGPTPFPGGTPAEYPGPSPPPAAAAPTEEARAAKELLGILRTTHQTFLAQCRVRNELVAAMRGRLGIGERLEYERFFSRYYREMTEEERYIHAIIRAYTENVLSQQNARALKILEDHPALVERVALLDELRRHLTLWLGKYKAVLQASPAACLIYVGVEERVPFPSGVEKKLQAYLDAVG
jgi:hypothetical protein